MYIVQPGSATVNTNGVLVSPVSTRAPTLTDDRARNRDGDFDELSPMSATARPRSDRPRRRGPASARAPVRVTRTSCSGASGGPVNSSVDSAEITCMSELYGANPRGVAANRARDRLGSSHARSCPARRRRT